MCDSILSKFLEIIFPPKCVFCKCFVVSEQEICDACKKKLRTIKNQYVVKFDYGEMFFEGCVSLFYYLPPISDMICGFKFRGKCAVKNTLASFVCEVVKEKYGDLQFDCVMFVPELNRKTKHCRLIAEQISEILGLPLVENLVKLKANQKQHKLKLKARRENVKGAYGLNDARVIAGKIVLLVDDVVTTGSTFNECARVLKANGVAKVFCATIATTPATEDLCLASGLRDWSELIEVDE